MSCVAGQQESDSEAVDSIEAASGAGITGWVAEHKAQSWLARMLFRMHGSDRL